MQGASPKVSGVGRSLAAVAVATASTAINVSIGEAVKSLRTYAARDGTLLAKTGSESRAASRPRGTFGHRRWGLLPFLPRAGCAHD